jgi:Tol biopolymer transport system component
MKSVGRSLTAAAAGSALLLGGLSMAAGVQASECPNAAVRSGADRALPDCRAYEQASPVDKNGNDVGVVQAPSSVAIPASVAAADGSGIAYETAEALPGAAAALQINGNLSRRGPSGWTSQPLSAPQSPVPAPDYSTFAYFTQNLDSAVVGTPPGPSHAAGDTVGARNFYLRNNADGTYRTLSVLPPVDVLPSQMVYLFAGASADLTHVMFTSADALTPDAPHGVSANLYEWINGQLRLVTILPDHTPALAGGGPGGPTGVPTYTAMSDDGSRIVFGTPDNNPQDGGQIYLRTNGQDTVEVSASRRTPADPGGAQPPRFWGASADVSQIFFSSSEALTDDADLGVNSLYRYDVDSGTLTDLTIDADPSSPPGDGLAGVLGLSRDGSQGYFESTRQYVAGKGVPGLWNLYRWHGNAISYVLTDDVGDPIAFEAVHKTTRVTPDGDHLVFTSSRSLTGYDNTDVVTGQPDREVFLYDAPIDKLTCVSCDPSGRRPTGSSTLPEPPARQGAANLQRDVSDDGRRVFFESEDALVPADVNQKQDVYEYEDGAVHLISSGTSSDDSYFADASKTGDDVFFVTRDRLASTDVDDNRDMYDARVGGGFASVISRPCSGDACQGPPAPAPVLPAPVSTSDSGDGNVHDVTKPSASFRVTVPSKAARLQAARTGYVTLSVHVSEGGIVKARASRTVGGRATTVATGESHVARTATVRMRLHLAKSVRTALARKAKVRLSIRVSFSHARSAKTMTLELQR